LNGGYRVCFDVSTEHRTALNELTKGND
jgi:hypothetical protein